MLCDESGGCCSGRRNNGSGIMAQEEYLRERIDKAVKERLVAGIAKHTKIKFAKHKNDAGMMGAFYHFMQIRKDK